jgi:hypothetical protein
VSIIGGGGSVRNGKRVLKQLDVKIKNINTENGKKYNIFFYLYIINKNKDRQGLYCIEIEDIDTGESVSIGELLE